MTNIQENIRCSSSIILRIGDVVTFYLSEKDREWTSSNLPKNGTKGIVIGFKEYFTSKDYDDENPGIYRGNGAAWVKWEDRDFAECGGNGVCLPKEVYEKRLNDKNSTESIPHKEHFKISDLPKFDYMVGNKVLIDLHGRKEIGTISRINFEEIVCVFTGFIDPTSYWDTKSIFNIALDDGGSVIISYKDIVKKLEEGNYWAYHNDKSKLHFKDFEEEIKFYKTLGKIKEIKNPTTNKYSWEIEEAVKSVRNGIGDFLASQNAFFASSLRLVVYKVDDSLPELKERLRNKTIEGFKNDFV